MIIVILTCNFLILFYFLLKQNVRRFIMSVNIRVQGTSFKWKAAGIRPITVEHFIEGANYCARKKNYYARKLGITNAKIFRDLLKGYLYTSNVRRDQMITITQKIAIRFESRSACWKGSSMGHERKQALNKQQLWATEVICFSPCGH